jgi:2-phospho-L-lactate transferase/gluconeogenesis factor (CofD/UPF0052 family)
MVRNRQKLSNGKNINFLIKKTLGYNNTQPNRSIFQIDNFIATAGRLLPSTQQQVTTIGSNENLVTINNENIVTIENF